MNTIKKRLHISGLTSTITADDINVRLQKFGKVVALDEFGLCNALGEPRKFAYATLETTESNLSRCLSHLSGTTWKGAKLRIGEAKPDYAQRLEEERRRVVEDHMQPPSKRRRLPHGMVAIHAKNMSVVNLENWESRPGWHKTPLEHLIRPMKMRPLRPLRESTAKGRLDIPRKNGKKSILRPTARTRIQVIDPRQYEAVHLGENMLEAMPGVKSGTMASIELEPPRELAKLVPSEQPMVDPEVATELDPPRDPLKQPSPEKPKAKSLKDLFQSRERAEAGFSLLANLGDLDLDPNIESIIATRSTPPPALSTHGVPTQPPRNQGGFELDPNLPMFFPQPDNPRAKDLFGLARTEGWEFGRSGDSASISQRWEETKGPLTREWKKRAREAVKARKRIYGHVEDDV